MRTARSMEYYLVCTFAGFLDDPPTTDFQRGYLSALLEMYRELVDPPYNDIYGRVMQLMRGGVLCESHNEEQHT